MKRVAIALVVAIVAAIVAVRMSASSGERGQSTGGLAAPQEPPPREDPEEDAAASPAKVHFMRKFVAALTAPPENLMPAAAYAPLLKDGAPPIGCVDCHKSMDVEAKLATDPGPDAAQRFRMRRNFMVPLMEKWVARLNKRHADRLRKEVTCTDCHAQDPRDDAALLRTFSPLMMSFVSALRERPRNENPAKQWKPLLKDPRDSSMLCAECHGQEGAAMEKALPALGRSPLPKQDRTFMIRLMERWVHELNRRMKDRLVRAVGCTDCHEIDPRK